MPTCGQSCHVTDTSTSFRRSERTDQSLVKLLRSYCCGAATWVPSIRSRIEATIRISKDRSRAYCRLHVDDRVRRVRSASLTCHTQPYLQLILNGEGRIYMISQYTISKQLSSSGGLHIPSRMKTSSTKVPRNSWFRLTLIDLSSLNIHKFLIDGGGGWSFIRGTVWCDIATDYSHLKLRNTSAGRASGKQKTIAMLLVCAVMVQNPNDQILNIGTTGGFRRLNTYLLVGEMMMAEG